MLRCGDRDCKEGVKSFMEKRDPQFDASLKESQTRGDRQVEAVESSTIFFNLPSLHGINQ